MGDPSRARAIGYLASVVIAAATGLGVGRLASGSSPVLQHWTVTSAAVNSGFNDLVTDGSTLFIDGYDNVCESSKVDPGSLRLETSSTGCNAVPPGERFAVQYGRLGSLRDYWNCKPQSAAVRLVTFDPASHADVVGRIVMRVSGTCSHDYPITVYAAGSVWVYDSSAGPTGRSGAIAQLSAETGKLEAFVTIPSMPAAVVAADTDGFFVGPGEFFQPGQGIYHVAPGSSRAQFVQRVPGPMAWLFGFDHSMFAAFQFDYSTPCTDRDCQLWQLSGPRATAKLINRDVDTGADPPVGAASIGIIIVRPHPSSYATSIDVMLVTPSTGAVRTLTRLPITPNQYVESTAYVDGAAYFLVEGELFRVTTSG